jgi:uncharacterized damage-inducible protein DinB
MPMIDAIRGEFANESATTRRLLERVPEASLGWKPHERSMTLGRLATHVSEMPRWGGRVLHSDELDLASLPPGSRAADATTVRELLELFDVTAEAFLAAARDVPDERMRDPWRLRRGEHVVFELPRAAALRGFVLNHVIHHRGQLSVYLRLLDVPLPPIYGPTADSQMPGA